MNEEQLTKNYIQEKLNPILEEMVLQILMSRPDNVNKNEKKEQENSSNSGSSDDSYIEELPQKAQKKDPRQRQSVSAEVFGEFNKKGNFKPKVIAKNLEQKQRIKTRLNQAFMFQALDEKETEIIINAMDEKKFQQGDWIIKQGEDGENLYVVDQGELDCFKKFKKDQPEPTHLKVYKPGESFGELALLYNAPRAASIQAKTNAVLFSLDRDTFNHIVKDAAAKKRQKYDDLLKKVELFDQMDPYERSQIADAFKTKSFKQGEYIVKQGDVGNEFFIVEHGTLVALKQFEPNQPDQKVYEYKSGDYFGELALLKNQPRAASILCTSEVQVVFLDRDSFKRLIGPLENILERNQEKYKKFM